MRARLASASTRASFLSARLRGGGRQSSVLRAFRAARLNVMGDLLEHPGIHDEVATEIPAAEQRSARVCFVDSERWVGPQSFFTAIWKGGPAPKPLRLHPKIAWVTPCHQSGLTLHRYTARLCRTIIGGSAYRYTLWTRPSTIQSRTMPSTIRRSKAG
jgi:hypothetical protein